MPKWTLGWLFAAATAVLVGACGGTVAPQPEGPVAATTAALEDDADPAKLAAVRVRIADIGEFNLRLRYHDQDAASLAPDKAKAISALSTSVVALAGGPEAAVVASQLIARLNL